ncbi:hypothetical protein BV898_12085 [Hypsibius exemplaris]|uniref:HTH CENPB-type domain-containing protein n=1 Tax=Hypsibius exemplaris TaxID=2072580 RepID=A0A1W0WEQ7_HYPEX|nr:hypothetical protein BV898_12085 [Hypsibius exemplaris]
MMDAPLRKKAKVLKKEPKVLTNEERSRMIKDLTADVPMTLANAAKKYGVSTATVRRIRISIPPDSDNLDETFEPRRKRPRKRKYPELDAPLNAWAASLRKQEIVLKREDVKDHAVKLAKKLAKDKKFLKFKASDHWLNLILKHCPAVKERLHPDSASLRNAASLPQSVTPRPAKPSQHATKKGCKSLIMAAVEERTISQSGKPAGPIPQHGGMRNTLTSEKPSPRITPTEQKMYQFFRNLQSGAKDYLNDVEWSVEKILDHLKNLLLSDVVPDDARPSGSVTRKAAIQTQTTTGDLGAVKKGDILSSGESDYEVVRVLHSGSTGQWVTCFKRETVDEMVQMKIFCEHALGAFQGRCEIELKRHDVYESPGEEHSFRQIFGCFRHKSRVCLFFDSRGASLFREWINKRDFFTSPPFADVIMDEIRCYMVGALLELVGLCIMPDSFWRHRFPSNVFVFVLKANYTMVQMVVPSAQDGCVEDITDSRCSAESSPPVQCPDQPSDEPTNSSAMSPTIAMKAPSSDPSFPRLVTIQGAGMKTAFAMQDPGSRTAATTQITGKRTAASPDSTSRKKRLQSFPEPLVRPQSTAAGNYSEQPMVLDINEPWRNHSLPQIQGLSNVQSSKLPYLISGPWYQEPSATTADPRVAAPCLQDAAFAGNTGSFLEHSHLPQAPAAGGPRDFSAPAEGIGDLLFCAPSLDSSHRDGFQNSLMAQDSAYGLSQGSTAPISENLIDPGDFNLESWININLNVNDFQNSCMVQDPNYGNTQESSAPIAIPGDPEFL